MKYTPIITDNHPRLLNIITLIAIFSGVVGLASLTVLESLPAPLIAIIPASIVLLIALFTIFDIEMQKRISKPDSVRSSKEEQK